MNKPLLILAGAVAALGVAGSAAAATYTSLLEYRDGLVGPQPAYGTVTINEQDAFTVQVTVTLTDPDSLFIDTGQPFNHNPFVFNTNAVDTVTPTGGFTYAGKGNPNATPASHDTWQNTPFGVFTDKIECCTSNGQAGGRAGPLVFTVSNGGGLTFGGIGATVDGNGKLVTLGTGNHFTSNDGGWWFAADIYDGATGQTYNVAARDAFRAVPEPATWAMMLLGFGGMGAVLRSQRRRRAAALA